MILPVPGAGFEWQRFGERSGLVCVPMASLATHVFTGRDWSLGAIRGPDGLDVATSGSDRAGWRAVARAVGVDIGGLRRARQVHGADVSSCRPEPADALPAADVIVVSDVGDAAAIQVADCVPLLIADRMTGAVSAVHAGWRGLAAGAPRVAVEALVTRCRARVTDLVAAIGPAIGPCCYEVGLDVRQAFHAAGHPSELVASWFHDVPVETPQNPSLPSVAARRGASREGRSFFDTWSAAAHQLTAAGVPASQVFRADLCTASHPAAFCSYRRDGNGAGRLAAAIRCRPRRP